MIINMSLTSCNLNHMSLLTTMPKLFALEHEAEVLALASLKWSHQAITDHLIAKNVQISRKTVSNMINRTGKRRQCSEKGEEFVSSGHRTKRTASAISEVKRIIREKSGLTQSRLAEKLICSPRTVRRIISDDLGYRCCKKTRVHKLQERHIKSRRTNSRKLLRSTIRPEMYEYLVTMDEAWLYLDDCGKGSQFCYLKKGQQRSSHDLIEKSELSNKKVMVLAIMTGRGVIPLKFVPPKTKINSNYYCDEVLKPLIQSWLPKLYPEGLEKVFVHHDAAPSHVSKKTTDIMAALSESSGITFIQRADIPVKAPDASPLDFFGFGYLKQRLAKRRPTTLDGLRKSASAEWATISPELCLKVFSSWRTRLREIERVRGHHIEHLKSIHKKKVQ